MPSIQKIRTLTVPVEVNHGDEKITLLAHLEWAASQEMRQRLLDLETEADKIRDEIHELTLQPEVLISNITALKMPPTADILRFRGEVEAAFATVVEVASQALTSETVEEAKTETTRVIERAETARIQLEAWSQSLMATPEEYKAREEETRTKLLAVRDDIAAKRAELHANYVERLLILVQAWDVTETDAEDSPIWPLTAENLFTLSPDLLLEMLGEVEKKVRRRSQTL